MGFVQPGVDFELGVKFRPTADTVARCAASGYAIAEDGIIAVPIRVFVPDQALPVYYTLRAQLTTGAISFSQTSVDFGETYITQAMSKTITLTNQSLLPQRFGFPNLPPESLFTLSSAQNTYKTIG